MKEFIINFYEILLQIALVIGTLGSFYLGYNLGFETNFFRGLVFGLAGFVSFSLAVGLAFTVLRIKELLEKQLYYFNKYNKKE